MRKLHSNFVSGLGRSKCWDILNLRPKCHTVSKALCTSFVTMSAFLRVASAESVYVTMALSASSVDVCGRKPNCVWGIKALVSRCCLSL